MSVDQPTSFVVVQSVPRSGSSWLGQLLNSNPHVEYRYQPLHSYSFPGFLTSDASEQETHEFFGDLLRSEEAFINMRPGFTAGDARQPEFPKGAPTHVSYKEVHNFQSGANAIKVCPHTKMIGLIRNPVDVINSWYTNPSEFDPNWNIDEEWMYARSKNSEYSGNHWGLEQWITVTKEMLRLQQNSSQIMLVKYEELVSRPLEVVSRVFSWLGLECEQQTRDFVETSMSEDQEPGNPYSIFRARSFSSASKRRLPSHIQTDIRDAVRGAGLGDFLADTD